MPFVFKKVLDHGTTNPIVARLSLHVLNFLYQFDVTKSVPDPLAALYLTSLLLNLLRS